MTCVASVATPLMGVPQKASSQVTIALWFGALVATLFTFRYLSHHLQSSNQHAQAWACCSEQVLQFTCSCSCWQASASLTACVLQYAVPESISLLRLRPASMSRSCRS
jgi:hypothetical protein